MVIEYARSVLGDADASSTEFEPDTSCPVIATMEEQKAFVDGAGDLGGTMRLGLYPASLKDGSVVRETYGQAQVEERHRHRYEVNNAYRADLEAAGLVFSGTSPDGTLVEFVELPRETHPYYVSTQAHPEFLSRPNRAHALFAGLVGAALERQRAGRLVEVERQHALQSEGQRGDGGEAHEHQEALASVSGSGDTGTA
jgi:CTP synthase